MIFYISSTRNPTHLEFQEVEKIVKQNYYKNGGQLRGRHLFNHFGEHDDILVMSKYQNQCVGYTYLRATDNILHVRQIVVLDEFKNEGIGSAMYEFIKHHSEKYDAMTASVRKSNEVSINFHQKNGFEILSEQNSEKFCMGNSLDKVEDRTDFVERQEIVYDSDSSESVERQAVVNDSDTSESVEGQKIDNNSVNSDFDVKQMIVHDSEPEIEK